MVNAGDCRCQRGLGLTAGCRRFVLQKVPFFRAGSASPMAPAVCFAKSTFFPRGLGFPDGGRRFVLQKVPFFRKGSACPMAAGSLFCKKYLFFARARLVLQKAPIGGRRFVLQFFIRLVGALWLSRMQSYICTMIIAVLRLRLKVGIVGEVETQKPRGAFAVEPAGRFRRSAGCAPCSGLSTGSRRSLSPKARVTFSSVARVGLPSSDSAS